VLGRIRYDHEVIEAQIRGLSAVEHIDGVAADDIRRNWSALVEVLQQNKLVDDQKTRQQLVVGDGACDKGAGNAP
jgi:hypothetical protein